MKTISFILISSILIGCANPDKNRSDEKEGTLLENMIVDSSNGDRVSGQIHDYIPIGKWKLYKINAPWDMEPIFPKREFWNINAKGEIIIQKEDSIIDSVACHYVYVSSGFSSDSVWVINGDFNNDKIQTSMEIWRKEGEMTLLDQCDDCYSFEFEKIGE